MSGGELIFEMGPRPNLNWGSSDPDVPVSELKAPEIVPVPVIKAFGRTFKDFLLVTRYQALTKTWNFISPPMARSPRSGRKDLRGRSCSTSRQRLKRLPSIAGGKRASSPRRNYHQIPHKWALVLSSKYSSQYNGGGDLAMIDGIRGTTNWSGGGWQGYQGQDLVATIDLGKVQKVSRLGRRLSTGCWFMDHDAAPD